MESARLSQLLDEYFDAGLVPADKLELEHLLLQYPAARERFWRRAGWEGLLQQWGEQHWGIEGLKLLPATTRRSRGGWIAAALAAAVALAAFIWWPRKSGPPVGRDTPPAALLRYASAPQWTGLDDPAPGEALPRASLKLTAGLVTLELPSGALVSIEGPAEWTTTGANALRLQRGRATAQVPERARGFRVETPAGDVVDFGTVFGVKVDADGAVETHVFEGKVELRSAGRTHPLAQGTALRHPPGTGEFIGGTAEPRRFPSPERRLGDVLIGGGFEPGLRFKIGSIPARPGEWCGDLCELVEARDHVEPHEGKLMLRFLRADNGDAPDRGTPRTGSELWQLIDVRELRRRADTTGPLVAEARAAFNSGRDRAARFSLRLVAWRGSARQSKQAWTSTLAAPQAVVGTTETKITSDRDPHTWETAEAALTLPPEADYLLLAVASFGSEAGDFPANFADRVVLQVNAPPQPSRLASE